MQLFNYFSINYFILVIINEETYISKICIVYITY